MITAEDVIKAFPKVEKMPTADIAHWVSMANVGITKDRFPAQTDRARILYVAHNLVKNVEPPIAPPLHPKTKRPIRANQWTTTRHGHDLLALARF